MPSHYCPSCRREWPAEDDLIDTCPDCEAMCRYCGLDVAELDGYCSRCLYYAEERYVDRDPDRWRDRHWDMEDI